jgi:hypothetical protein
MNYSGIMHVHSTYSYDGEVSLAELRALCERVGIQFVCLTEHVEGLSEERKQAFIHECHERSDVAFLFIPGFEVPFSEAHILKLGGDISVVAHPHRSGFVVPTLCTSVEIWNSQYDGKRFPRWTAVRWFQKIKKTHPDLYALAGVDLHRPSHLRGPRLVLDVDVLDEESILHAIREGRYQLVSDACVVDSQGHVVRPQRIRALLGSIIDVSVIWGARIASSVAKRLGLHRLSFFGRMREYIRKKV